MSVRSSAMTRLVLGLALAALSLANAGGALAQQDGDSKKRTERKAERKPEAKADRKTERKPERKREAKPERKPDASSPAAGATLVGTFNDWGAYTAQSGRAKICYALSEPKARSPGSLKDTKGYLFVSFRPADNVRNEVASVLNFDTKDGSAGALAIGQASFELVTKGKNAWVKNPSDEADAIAAMSKGGTLTLQATSARGNKTSDRYSLAGFAQAIDRARRDCP